MEIEITTKHFREASNFLSNTKCPLALAIKDVVPEGTYIGVGGEDVDIDNKYYLISLNWGRGEHTPTTIGQMIRDAKQGIEIPTVTVVLKKYLL
jgi:hypothetical protein